MDKEEDKLSKKSPTRNENLHSNKPRKRDLQQLISLHRRYEDDALRYFRRGYVSPTRNSTENISERSGKWTFARDLSRRMVLDYFPRLEYVNDDDYFNELLGNFEEKKLDKSTERLTLKLPKMDSISAENKAIFYTTLPKIPSLPPRNENKRNERTYFRSRNVSKCRSSRSNDESFFKIKPATLSYKEERFFEDSNAIRKVRESNCQVVSQLQVVLPKACSKKDPNVKQVNERSLQNQTAYRLSSEDDSKVKNISKKPELLNDNHTKESISKKRDGKNDKTVQFCKLLHEVHVYSPSFPNR